MALNPEHHPSETLYAHGDGFWYGIRPIQKSDKQELIKYAQSQGLDEMVGYVLNNNQPMLHLMKDLDFEINPFQEDAEFKKVSLILH